MPTTRAPALAILPHFLGACCPSLWLTVTKGDPFSAAGDAEAGDRRRPDSDAATSREPLRRAEWEALSSDYAAYTDALDANMSRLADVSEVAVRRVHAAVNPTDRADDSGVKGAPNGRAEFINRYADTWHHPASTPVGGAPTDATVAATFVDCGFSSPCQVLRISEPIRISNPSVATITTCQGTTVIRPIQSVKLCEAVPAVVNQPPACPGQTAEATYITLATPVTTSPCDGVVSVTLSNTKDALAQTLFTFIHLSDIQIRDPDIRLGNVKLSHELDPLIQSFEYDHDMEFYNRYVVEALLATINKEVALYDDDREDPERPTLVIHTGDAIDSGVTTELRDVHRLVDRLKIPFFDVIGNHDVLTFGNLLPIDTRDSDSTCVTAPETARPARTATTATIPFIKKHVLTGKLCVDRWISCPNCLPKEVALVAGDKHALSRQTFTAGFQHDSARTVPQLPNQTGDAFTCDELRPLVTGDTQSWVRSQSAGDGDGGLLRVQQAVAEAAGRGEAPAPPLRRARHERPQERRRGQPRTNPPCADDLAATRSGLRGGEPEHVGLRIRTPPDQRHRNRLGPAHDRSIDRPDERARTGSFAKQNVIAYFYGHEHLHRICGDGRPNTCTHFWEIETGSVIEFPQEGRLVRLRYVGGGIAFLDLVAFKEHLTNGNDDFGQAVALARSGAQRDYCQDPSHDVTCTADKRVIRTDGRHTNGRLFFRLP